MKYAVWVILILLVILHQDFWLWTDGTLLLDIFPAGLAYHMGLSVAAAIGWWLATKFAWPLDNAEPVDAPSTSAPRGNA